MRKISQSVYVSFLNSLTYILATRKHEFRRKERNVKVTCTFLVRLEISVVQAMLQTCSWKIRNSI